jgi:RHS repeat-associated protein
MDRRSHSLAPVDQAGDPERRTSYTYDKMGNLLTATEPKGNLSPAAGDFVTTNAYDEIYQLTSVTNALGHRLTYEYNSVGNVTRVADARKNATADPTDHTTAYEYDRAHRLKKIIDPLGNAVTRTYDKDGRNVATTDQNGNTMLVTLDARGRPTESKVPHRTDNGTIVYRTTKFEYDQVGNQTRVISPRGVETTDDPNDFAAVSVYDELNRVKETRTPFDEDDARYNQPDITRFEYDAVGRLARQSAPPSSGESVRNDTTYTYFDNGWTRTSADPWDIATEYTYNELGGQTSRTVRSAGGSATRTITWTYHPDGKLKTRADDGVPVGQQVVLVDNSDFNNAIATGTWPAATAAADKQGPSYAFHPAGTGANTFTWQLNVPQDGNYEVFVRYPTVSGAATDARYTVTHNGDSTVRTVNQSASTGTWVSLGSFAFDEGNGHRIALSDQANGTVLADAVKLVRDNAADVDNEKHDYAYRYDPNNNLLAITDASPGARVDRYAMTYTGLNQVASVVESKAAVTVNTTSYEYDENGAPVSLVHDKQHDTYVYDPRNLVSRITNRTSATDPEPKVSTYTYTPRGERLQEVKGNGNTVDYTYYLDGLLRSQAERKANETLVSEHSIEYNLNGHRTRDVSRKMNADNNSDTLSTTSEYRYDPQDRVASVTKTGTGAGTETYVHDANGNVVSQSVGGVATTFNYDRNRLLTSAAGGVTSSYNYDPFGRLDTITAAGTVFERNVYDGFDHVIENRKNNGAGTSTTRYTFDPLDRTSTKTTDAGTADAETTVYNYLGLSSEVLDEEVADKITKSYQMSPWGQRLSQVTRNDDGTEEDAYYGFNPHSDVEQLTDEEGDSKATYGYTAYGQDDVAQFTGIDKPDAADPTKEPYNAYRFNAKRFDPASGSYDMGFRDYSPGLNRFVTRDSYNGALADLNLGLNPYTGNRYAFGGGNPISGIEIDGHFAFAIPFIAAAAAAALPIVAAVVVAVVVIVAVAYVATQVKEHLDERAREDAAEEAEPQPEPRRPPPIPVGDPRRSPRGCGWVEFGDLDAARGNRATGVTACLNSAYLATHEGSSPSVDPPGIRWAQRTAGFLGGNPDFDINRCHLLGAQLSGSGSDLRNLAPCSRSANFPVPGSTQGANNMYNYETQVRQAIDEGQDVYYQVIPQYSGDRTVPTGFTITAIGYRADGSIGLQIEAYVPNDLFGRNLGEFNDPNTGQPVPTGAMQ